MEILLVKYLLRIVENEGTFENRILTFFKWRFKFKPSDRNLYYSEEKFLCIALALLFLKKYLNFYLYLVKTGKDRLFSNLI